MIIKFPSAIVSLSRLTGRYKGGKWRFLGDVSSLVGKVEIPGFSGNRKSWKWNGIVSQVDNRVENATVDEVASLFFSFTNNRFFTSNK